MELIKYLVFIILIIGISQASSPEDDTYSVGVVEFARKFEGDVKAKLEANIKGYREVLKNSVNPGDKVDIIVFPEFQLNQVEDEVSVFVPDPKEKIILCNNNNTRRELLSELSCWAASYKKYMVFNLVEKENCTDKSACAVNGLNKYNTNLVFDRTGALIARYRKHHIFVEPGVNATKTVDLVTFDTDFGVKFGTFICFDVLFYEPPQELVKTGVTDFVYPTMWFSELPFLTANQIHFAWSYANNVNFLVSGGNLPIVGSTGSGIFAGKTGIVAAEMYGTTQKRMIIADVPKKKENVTYEVKQTKKAPSPVPDRLMGLKVSRDPTLDRFITVDLNETSINATVVHNDLSCSFQIKRKKMLINEEKKYYSFKMGAFSSNKTYPTGDSTLLSICAIFACTDAKNISTCGTIFRDDVTVINLYYFDEIIIEADFNKTNKMLIMPNSVDQQFKTLNTASFELNVTENGNKQHAIMKLKEPNSDLLTFGIYTSYFSGSDSGSDSGNNGQNSLKISFIIIMLSVVILKYFN